MNGEETGGNSRDILTGSATIHASLPSPSVPAHRVQKAPAVTTVTSLRIRGRERVWTRLSLMGVGWRILNALIQETA